MTYSPINWTEEMDNAICVSFELPAKPNLGELAKTLGISTKVVSSRVTKLGYSFTKSTWSDEDITSLKEEWQKGTTVTEIGKLIGKTRNAVIGKAFRLRLERRCSRNGYTIPVPSQKKKAKTKRIRKTKNMAIIGKKAVAPRFYPMAVPITDKAPITIMGLNASTCHAIVGHGPDGLAVYCGDFTFADKPYCEGHCAMYYQPPGYRSNHRRR